MLKHILLFLTLIFSTACSDTTQPFKLKEIHQTIEVQHKNKMGVSIYYNEHAKKRPIIYFLSAATSDRRSYAHLFKYLVKKGYVVVGLSTQSFASDFMTYHFYDAITFARKVCNEQEIGDESRVGLTGHSSGAGFLPSLGYKLFTQDQLGKNGRFIFGASPWIDFQYTNDMRLPQDTNFVTELFEHDDITDPRIYFDMFNQMKVNNKAFIMVKEGANHQTIFHAEPRALVKEGIYKPLLALANYTFNHTHKEAIFSQAEINSRYLKIEAQGQLPSNRVYQSMLEEFRRSGSSFGCKTTAHYIPNPREADCLNYRHREE